MGPPAQNPPHRTLPAPGTMKSHAHKARTVTRSHHDAQQHTHACVQVRHAHACVLLPPLQPARHATELRPRTAAVAVCKSQLSITACWLHAPAQLRKQKQHHNSCCMPVCSCGMQVCSCGMRDWQGAVWSLSALQTPVRPHHTLLAPHAAKGHAHQTRQQIQPRITHTAPRMRAGATCTSVRVAAFASMATPRTRVNTARARA